MEQSRNLEVSRIGWHQDLCIEHPIWTDFKTAIETVQYLNLLATSLLSGSINAYLAGNEKKFGNVLA